MLTPDTTLTLNNGIALPAFGRTLRNPLAFESHDMAPDQPRSMAVL